MAAQIVSHGIPAFLFWPIAAGGAVAVWISYSIIYNLFISPLVRFPGPKSWAVSYIPSQASAISGNHHKNVLALHDQYGPIVRTGPTTLSFNTAQAFKDVYGFRQGVSQFPKDPKVYGSPMMSTRDAIGGFLDNETHSRHRRLMSHGFSDRALREQEARIVHFIDLFISRLRDLAHKGQDVDIRTWLNFTTFDITGDLMFAETFDCLQDSQLHPWIGMIFSSIRANTTLTAIRHFPFLTMLQEAFTPESFRRKLRNSFNLTVEKADRRLLKGTARPDFMSAILKNGIIGEIGAEKSEDKQNRMMTRHEIHANSTLCVFLPSLYERPTDYTNLNSIILAGSETTATALSGCMYLLCTNKEALNRLSQEIRSTFRNDADITSAQCVPLPYLNAVIEETLRIYPPVATHLPRVVPKGGATVAGEFLPEDTTISVPHYASYLTESNFVRPTEFLPERWLGADAQFEADKKDTLQPFVLGPRNCLGKNLAYLEMRVILSKLVFNFDIELCSGSEKWIDQQSYFLWDKPALMVRLTDRVSG